MYTLINFTAEHCVHSIFGVPMEFNLPSPHQVVGGLKGFYEGRAVSLPVMDNGGEGTSISAGGTDMFVQCMP